jgi:enolase
MTETTPPLGRWVWDSRGRSTLEADIVLKAGATAKAIPICAMPMSSSVAMT